MTIFISELKKIMKIFNGILSCNDKTIIDIGDNGELYDIGDNEFLARKKKIPNIFLATII